MERLSVVAHSLKQRDNRGFAFALQHTVNRTPTMLEDLLRNKRSTVSTYENETIWQLSLRRGSEIKDLGDVGEIVAGKGDNVWLPVVNQPEIVRVALGLQIDQPHVMPALTGRRSYQFKAQRLQAQVDFRVHQTTGMDGEKFHNSQKTWGI